MDMRSAMKSYVLSNAQKKIAEAKSRDYVGALVQLSKQKVAYYDRYGKKQGIATRQTINGMSMEEAIARALGRVECQASLFPNAIFPPSSYREG